MNYVDFPRRQVVVVRAGVSLSLAEISDQVDYGMAVGERHLGAAYSDSRKRVVDDLFALRDLLAVWESGLDAHMVSSCRQRISVRPAERLFFRSFSEGTLSFDRVRFSRAGVELVSLELVTLAVASNYDLTSEDPRGWAVYEC